MDSSDDEAEEPVPLDTDSESADEEMSDEENMEQDMEYNSGDYVLVKYELFKKRLQYYVGEIEKVEGENVLCNFLKKKTGGSYFYFPDQPDKDTVNENCVVLKLGKPSQSSSSARALTLLSFEVDLSRYNVI